MRKLKLLFLLLCISLLVNFFEFNAGADEKSKITQTYFTRDTLNAFAIGIIASSEITSEIENDDYYKIIYFDTDYRKKCEFINDRYDLLKYFPSFDYYGDSSMVYSAIFEAINIKPSIIDKNNFDNLLTQIKNNDFSAELESKNSLALYVVILVVCIVFAGGLSTALIIIFRQKTKKKGNNVENSSSPPDVSAKYTDKLHDHFDTVSFYLESDMRIIGSAAVVDGCEIVFGRSKDCDIVLNKNTVSRKQFGICMKNNKLYIKNISSSNITELNGKTLNHESVIIDGDKIKCGREIIVVQIYLSEKTIYKHV